MFVENKYLLLRTLSLVRLLASYLDAARQASTFPTQAWKHLIMSFAVLPLVDTSPFCYNRYARDGSPQNSGNNSPILQDQPFIQTDVPS